MDRPEENGCGADPAEAEVASPSFSSVHFKSEENEESACVAAAHSPASLHSPPLKQESADDMSTLVPFLQRTRPARLPAPSFALAPAAPLPLWQHVTLSALTTRRHALDSQHKFRHLRQTVSKELTRYHLELQERAERQQQQQRESRARAGERVAAGLQRYWSRRGDAYQQLVKVEFDVVKHQHDRRKQEDLLRETEMLTRKLLESFFTSSGQKTSGTVAAAPTLAADASGDERLGDTGSASESPAGMKEDPSNGAAAAAASPASSAASRRQDTTLDRSEGGGSFWAKVGDDDDAPIEQALSLLDTEKGQRPLRHYQRSSLRWMVHLYESNLNGILADEMGLGKTVQTIALLCYFAEYRNDWGPHLIVVPTTVVLNWKAEMDRWAPGLKVLTYIGSAKERHQLRKGWTSEDAFHVCITSYNLIVQDRKVFRRRPWGFLVLDEAHQVKNFMSIKWQSLFDLQAEYRLLLTGTPLQNSIMELWSLFHFLLPFASAFRSNAEFKEWFSNPMDAMITGQSSLNEDIVRRLQALIRPFMLRRLKKDVESQLPTKTEKVVLCRLSRRQRSLYDDYMQLADTRAKLRGGGGGGGAGGVFSVLLALRKVCDHPDLFEERPTVSPLVLGYEALIERVVPRAVLLLDNAAAVSKCSSSFSPAFYVDDLNLDAQTDEFSCGGKDTSREHDGVSSPSSFHWCSSPLCLMTGEASRLPWWAAQLTVTLPTVACGGSGVDQAEDEVEAFARRFRPPSGAASAAALQTRGGCSSDSLQRAAKVSGALTRLGGSTLQAAFLDVVRSSAHAARERARQTHRAQAQRYLAMRCARNVHYPRCCSLLHELRQAALARAFPALCPTVAERAAALFPVVQKVCVYVPAALAAHPPRLRWLLPIAHPAPFRPHDRASCAVLIGAVAKQQDAELCGRAPPRTCYDASFFLRELWPIQVRRSFSFPDKRLLIHDCGKLQFLESALKTMRQEGHRALIFTQFVNMLNILERFLALIGVAYLRLDGATKAETRQLLVDRFNADARLTCMILSTRSGGVGLNLTGADTVIFYDSDWNPTMDLQAQDRCHRIGQTRPVTIYRLISEHTVEESILQKARERKKLNNVVIRGGQFHTIAGVSEQYDDSAAAFAALSDPVNLRSFFHDLDEDATVTVQQQQAEEEQEEGRGPGAAAALGDDEGAAAAVRSEVLRAMAAVEDEEDRQAGQELEREMEAREAEEAAAAGEVEGSDDGGDHDEGEAEEGEVDDGSGPPRRKRARIAHGGDSAGQHGTQAKQRSLFVTADAASEAAWQRKGPNTLRDVYLSARDSPNASTALTPADPVDALDAGASGARDALVRRAVRKRQRELVRKAATPLDQLLTLHYGRCQRDDAEVRYASLVETYEAQMDELELQESEEEEEDDEDEEASGERKHAARLPPFHAMFHLH